MPLNKRASPVPAPPPRFPHQNANPRTLRSVVSLLVPVCRANEITVRSTVDEVRAQRLEVPRARTPPLSNSCPGTDICLPASGLPRARCDSHHPVEFGQTQCRNAPSRTASPPSRGATAPSTCRRHGCREPTHLSAGAGVAMSTATHEDVRIMLCGPKEEPLPNRSQGAVHRECRRHKRPIGPREHDHDRATATADGMDEFRTATERGNATTRGSSRTTLWMMAIGCGTFGSRRI